MSIENIDLKEFVRKRDIAIQNFKGMKNAPPDIKISASILSLLSFFPDKGLHKDKILDKLNEIECELKRKGL